MSFKVYVLLLIGFIVFTYQSAFGADLALKYGAKLSAKNSVRKGSSKIRENTVRKVAAEISNMQIKVRALASSEVAVSGAGNTSNTSNSTQAETFEDAARKAASSAALTNSKDSNKQERVSRPSFSDVRGKY